MAALGDFFQRKRRYKLAGQTKDISPPEEVSMNASQSCRDPSHEILSKPKQGSAIDVTRVPSPARSRRHLLPKSTMLRWRHAAERSTVMVSAMDIGKPAKETSRHWKGSTIDVARLMQDLKMHNAAPDLATYSTILKGHCQAGDMDLAIGVLDQTRLAKLKPDEIMYNTLLHGCCQHELFEQGMELLQDMQRHGVVPSNWTLSILVRMSTKADSVEEAFCMVRDITRKFAFRPNLEVYTAMIQACLLSTSENTGLLPTVVQNMVEDEVRPDHHLRRFITEAMKADHKRKGIKALPKATRDNIQSHLLF